MNDFAAFILTHGRPDRVLTYATLRKHGYTGRIVLVVDDEDKTREEYERAFPGEVVVFDKRKTAAEYDEADNFNDRRSIFYARNASFGIARRLGLRHFIQLDDDYSGFFFRFDADLEFSHGIQVRSLDRMFAALVEFKKNTPALSVATAQGGDFFGGNTQCKLRPLLRRKAMNSFVCDVERPFSFLGRVNEDVSTYTTLARRGALFFTVLQAQLSQKQTQTNAGGMTEMYLDSGTYLKSFYSVMHAPSCVKISVLKDPQSSHPRIHHRIDWRHAAAKILAEKHRKTGVRRGEGT